MERASLIEVEIAFRREDKDTKGTRQAKPEDKESWLATGWQEVLLLYRVKDVLESF